ncbi:transposase [Patescibacteria group bacterium]|nr:transposase [Patescibacteria group bacterium]
MPSPRIPKEYASATYFLTFTIKNWYYIFDRHNRFQILADSLTYCQKYKQLKIHAYVFMLNHIHLVISSPDVIGFVRDFKKFTSKEMQKNIIAFEPNVLKLFESLKGGYEFWQPSNMPKIIESEDFFNQKVEYIHYDPVRKQYVKNPEDWIWSSANQGRRIRVDPLPI